MYEQYGDRVQFLMVYIREAHPTDGRQSRANERDGILIKQATTLQERTEVAHKMCIALDFKLPAVIDGLDDAVNDAYSAWPDRLYLVSRDGLIAYKGGPGPGGFKPDEMKAAIEKELAE
jgi:hypothetical protein